MATTPRMIFFRAYDRDTRDERAFMTEEEYALLLPHAPALRLGNWPADEAACKLLSALQDKARKWKKSDGIDFAIEVSVC